LLANPVAVVQLSADFPHQKSRAKLGIKNKKNYD